jgi:hypothetical protein
MLERLNNLNYNNMSDAFLSLQTATLHLHEYFKPINRQGMRKHALKACSAGGG